VLQQLFPIQNGFIGRGRSLTVVTVIGLLASVSAAVLAIVLQDGWLGVLAFFGMLASLGGSYQAGNMLAEQTARRAKLACPACRTEAPIGAFWLCDRCWRYCDVFAVQAKCPSCGESFTYVVCPECNQRHPFEAWTSTATATVAEESVLPILPAEIVDVLPPALEEHLNAATYYRRAFTLLPKLTATEEELLEPDNVRTAPLNQRTLGLIRRSEPALQELREGATRTACDWKADSHTAILELGIDLNMAVLRLYGVTCLEARHAFGEGRGHAALDDLAAVLAMARHFGRAGPLMSRALQFGVESVAIDVAAADLLEQSSSALEGFRARLSSLPNAGTLATSMQMEKQFLLAARPQREPKNKEDAHVLLHRFCSPHDMAAMLKVVGADMSALMKMFDETAALYDELGGILMLPREKFQRTLGRFVQQYRKSNPMVVSNVQHFDGLHFAAIRDRMRMDMLKAAVNIVYDGGWQKAVRDRSRTGPFKSRSFRAGFELESRSWFVDKPLIKLLVGKENPGILERLGIKSSILVS
jgi:hypothetical protein